MNKKIKSISKTLLFSFLFSVFNPSCSLAMDDDITYVLLNSNQKLEHTEKEKSEVIKIKSFNTAFGECLTNVVNVFNKKYNHRPDSYFAKKMVSDKNFCNYFFEIMKNICNIKLLSYDNNPVTLLTLEKDMVELFIIFTEFMSQLYWFYCAPADKNLFTFKHSFNENDFLKKLTDWMNKVQASKLSDIEEIKNLDKDEKQKFVDYCSIISNNIYNIFMLSIENTCNNKRKLSATVEYSKTLENEVSDIIVQANIAHENY